MVRLNAVNVNVSGVKLVPSGRLNECRCGVNNDTIDYLCEPYRAN